MFKRNAMVLGVAALAVAMLGCVVPAMASSYRLVGDAEGILLCSSDWKWIGADLVAGRTYKITLSVPFGADFDVKVYYDRDHDKVAEPSELIAKGTKGTGKTESVVFTARVTGRHHFKVYSYSGGGIYILRLFRWV